MPSTPHVEKHFSGTEVVRDLVIGMSDGLTVPFALAAGLSGAAAASGVVVTAGVAEIAAGMIAMGLGGYLAARSDAEHFAAEESREHAEVKAKLIEERREVVRIFAEYGVSEAEAQPIVAALERDPDKFVAFMMRFELGLERPDPGRALKSGATIAVAYGLGGLVPLSPYFFAAPGVALVYSVLVTMIALAIFGFVKGKLTGAPPLRSSAFTLLVGGLAAGAAFGLARLLGG